MTNRKTLADLLSLAQAGEKFICESPEGSKLYSYELLERTSYTITEITASWGYDRPRIVERTVYINEQGSGELWTTTYKSEEDAKKALLPNDLGVRVFKEVLDG